MNAFYTASIILTELLMATMILHILHYSGLNRQQKTWYMLTFVSVIICSTAEFSAHCGYYNQSFSFLLTIITILQFSTAPLLGIFFVGALGLHEQNKIAISFFAVNLLTEITGAFFDWIFYFDELGYHRGEYFAIYVIFYIMSIIYLIAGMIIVAKRFNHRDARTIIMVLIIIMAGIIPMTIFHINIAYLAIAIGASICYIYYNDLVQQDIRDALVENQKKLSNMQVYIISGMANLIESRDLDTGGHISRTSAYVKILSELAREEGVYTDQIDNHFIDLMCTLAPMHDIGKIVVPDSILKKPGKLTNEEFEIMKKHAEMGGTIVKDILSDIADEEYISFASDIATYHHEWWNGKGYPYNLSGQDIPLSARIMAIADVFDALVSDRCYKKAMSYYEAFKIIQNEAGTHFDPELVQVFIKYKDKFKLTINGNLVT